MRAGAPDVALGVATRVAVPPFAVPPLVALTRSALACAARGGGGAP